MMRRFDALDPHLARDGNGILKRDPPLRPRIPSVGPALIGPQIGEITNNRAKDHVRRTPATNSNGEASAGPVPCPASVSAPSATLPRSR